MLALRTLFITSVVSAASLFSAGIASAEPYPSRNITFVVPFPAGGATDVIARLIGEKLSERLGKPVVIENVVGAGGMIASSRVAKAPADGHTILMGTIATHGIGPSLYRKIPYDAARDFLPITQALSQVYVLVVHPSVPAKNVAELIALAKQRPGELTYASASAGTAAHMFAELFKAKAGVDIRAVHYRGAAPAMNDVIGGHVSMTFDVLLTTHQHITSGLVRPLAVTSAHRSPAMPDVPTLMEAGMKDYDAVGWNGVFAPVGVPSEIAARLEKEIRAVLVDPALKARIAEQGAEVVASSSSQFAGFIKKEMEKWAAVTNAIGLKLD